MERPQARPPRSISNHASDALSMLISKRHALAEASYIARSVQATCGRLAYRSFPNPMRQCRILLTRTYVVAAATSELDIRYVWRGFDQYHQ